MLLIPLTGYPIVHLSIPPTKLTFLPTPRKFLGDDSVFRAILRTMVG